MMSRFVKDPWAHVVLFMAAAALLAGAILSRPAKTLVEFDQPFYVTMAYDLDRHGVLSNGIFVDIDSSEAVPQPGMFFGPVYPLLVFGVMQISPRFAEAVRCSVEADRGHRDENTCEPYETPVRVLHALLLALGVIAVANAARMIFASWSVFWACGALATAALATEADIFSFVMTESLTFCLYSVFALAMVLAWRSGRGLYFAEAGIALGLLCLTRLSFLVLFPLSIGLTLLCRRLIPTPRTKTVVAGLAVMTVTFAAPIGAWATRNAISVGKLGLSEEYGSAVLIERFAYDDMSLREFFQAFPFCTPGLGELAFDTVYGSDSMHRFVYHTPGSFFHIGRDERGRLVTEYGRLDPLIGGIVRTEMREHWWRHLLVSIPLAWCGMWPGWIVSLLLLPMFVLASLRATRQGYPLLLPYSASAVAMLGLHALIANHYTRYNLILIGPYAAGAAWCLLDLVPRLTAMWSVSQPATAPDG